jgi:peptidoglycan hydrolase CwlO-like protein
VNEKNGNIERILEEINHKEEELKKREQKIEETERNVKVRDSSMN